MDEHKLTELEKEMLSELTTIHWWLESWIDQIKEAENNDDFVEEHYLRLEMQNRVDSIFNIIKDLV